MNTKIILGVIVAFILVFAAMVFSIHGSKKHETDNEANAMARWRAIKGCHELKDLAAQKKCIDAVYIRWGLVQ